MLTLLLLAASPAPVDLPVPAALLERTCPPELSGITWVPALGRYLAVSDDTGKLDTATWHAPWLFTLDEQGAFDPAVRALEGVEALDDAESLTPGPDGTLLLTTSHAVNKGGAAKPARRQLLWLALARGRLVVRGRLDLSRLDLGRVAAGRDDELDVEGIAYRGGALFVGLKAPLDAEGRAVILRVPDLIPSFVAKSPPKLKASAWARLRLEVPDAEGQPVPQGVTDLLWLADGRLVLAANAPKSGRPDGGGALWLLERPDAPPALLHRFDGGLKPEGLTLTPDGSQLVVVFDRGPLPPQWVRLPRP